MKQAARRPSQTDFLVMALAPALIMTLVGSLTFFLIDVFCDGPHVARLKWVMFWFVMGIVLIARIAIEIDADRAALYGLALAGSVALVSMKLVGSPVVVWSLLALVWWCAHQLTWDCTLIDDNEDASGEGLLQIVGLDRPPPELERPDTPAPRSGFWRRLLLGRRRGEPHAPGLWVVYFSLAALPLFGIGQMLIPTADTDRREHAFWYMCVYATSALGLLAVTSLLGLRRYLRQRGLAMPAQMTGVWLAVAAAVVFLVLVVGSVLPRPGSSWFATRRPLAQGIPRPASHHPVVREGTGEGRGAPGWDQRMPSQQQRPASAVGADPRQNSAPGSQPPESPRLEAPQAQQGRTHDGQGPAQQHPGAQQPDKPESDRHSPGGQQASPAPTNQPPPDGSQQSAQPTQGSGQSGEMVQEPSDHGPQQGRQQDPQSKASPAPDHGPQHVGQQDAAQRHSAQPGGTTQGTHEHKHEPAGPSSQQQPANQTPPGMPQQRPIHGAQNERPAEKSGEQTLATGEKQSPDDSAEQSEAAEDSSSGTGKEPGAGVRQERPSGTGQQAPAGGQGTNPQPPHGGPSGRSPSLPSLGLSAMGAILKWLVYAALAVGAVLLILRHWRGLVRSISQLITDLANFLERLLGRQPQSASPPSEAPAPQPRPFAAFTNPFLTGEAAHSPPQTLLVYTYAALQAWAREQGSPPQADQTPIEFAGRLGTHQPHLAQEAAQLALVYSQMMYGRRTPDASCLVLLRRVWDRLSQPAVLMAAHGHQGR